VRICFVGDSFVNGTGDPDCLGWTGRVCASARHAGHDLTYYNLGIRRETSADIAGRWAAEVSRRLPPDISTGLVFSFGANDTTVESGQTRVSLSDSLAHTHAILAAARRRHAVLMVGPPPVVDADQNHKIAELSRRLTAVCLEVDVPYLPVVDVLLRSSAWIPEAALNDGAHPGAAGYAELALLVERWPAWQAWFPVSGSA
jgi:lysophospholipase L1-like esterase